MYTLMINMLHISRESLFFEKCVIIDKYYFLQNKPVSDLDIQYKTISN